MLAQARLGSACTFVAGLVSLAGSRHLPRGTPQPVPVFPGPVFPGLIASGDSTLVLRTLSWRFGNFPYGWAQGFHFGSRHGVIAGCRARVEESFAEHGQRLMSIGWSQDGIYAQEIARAVPGCVRQVITLGAPFTGRSASSNADPLFRLRSGHRVDRRVMA